MKTLALDPAASCGWAIGESGRFGPENIRWGTWTLHKAGKKEHPGQRLVRLRQKLFEAYREHRFERIVYEEASYGALNGQTSSRHSEKAGVILLVAAELELQATPIHPTTLKKALTGSGRAKKPDCVRAVAQRTNIDVGTEFDAADAIGLLFVESEG